ncbi:hypothetical protein [Rufibacter immobilis]|nr:hypothetical protein [Rufibacter immobilis]
MTGEILKDIESNKTEKQLRRAVEDSSEKLIEELRLSVINQIKELTKEIK